MKFTVVAYEVTELTRTVEADTVEEAIALAYHGSDTDWTEWSETTLGTNGIEIGFYSRICGWDWGSSGKFAGESVGVNVNPSASDGTSPPPKTKTKAF